MTRRSLRLRLVGAAAASIGLALVIAGFGLVTLFERHVARRLDAELENSLRQLAASVSFDADGTIRLARELADPRFRAPYSGLYWQIQEDATRTVLRSRSLWDARLALPADPLDAGTVHRHRIAGPRNATLMVREREITYTTPAGQRRLRIAVALDRRDLIAARDAFARDIAPSLAMLALVLIIAAWVQVGFGLRPLEFVRRAVNAVRSGVRNRLGDNYPDEVMPLVREVNTLLEAQERTIAQMRTRASDLAHGLKTPLTVLAADAARLRARGETEMADELEDLARTMRRHVDHELARYRIGGTAAPRNVRTLTAPVIHSIVKTLKRTPRGETLAWQVSARGAEAVAIDPDDLMELLGNLLDNASKWADSEVRISVAENAEVCITVEDDGPGVPEERLALLGQRGLRLDQQTQGTGQGLAIVKEIVGQYRGRVGFANLPAGGLRVTLHLPRA